MLPKFVKKNPDEVQENQEKIEVFVKENLNDKDKRNFYLNDKFNPKYFFNSEIYKKIKDLKDLFLKFDEDGSST